MKQGGGRSGQAAGAVLLALLAILCLGFASQAGAATQGLTRITAPGAPASPKVPVLEEDSPEVGGDVIPNHYIVVLEDSVKHPGAVADEQAEEVDGEVNLVYRSGLKGYAATMSRSDAATLRTDPTVKYVVPDRKVEVTGQATPAGIERVSAPKNTSLAIDTKENVEVDADIAIIDTGIDYEHPDLNVVARTNCVPPGESFETEYEYGECKDGAGSDGYGHGTHVAGTAAALDNGQGVVGVAPDARLWAVRVLNRQGSGTESWIIAGVDWVTAHAGEIEVANMSLGCECSMPALEEAIEASTEAGVVYTVSAGNSAKDAKDFSPAKNPDAITVSALAISDKNPGGQEPGACLLVEAATKENKPASFSNFGKDVDVIAPGTCIYSTLPDGEYWWLNGTSMAAPHVAGAAAILASKSNPEDLEDVESIRQVIEEEGSSAWEDTSGDGVQEPLLDVGDPSAFKAKAHPITQPASITSETEVTLHGLVNPGGLATEYRFEYGTTTAYGSSVPVSGKAIGSGTEYLSVAEALKGLKGQTLYHHRLVAVNSAGTFYGDDRTFGTTPVTTSIETPEVHANDATLKAAIDPEGLPASYRFEFGTTTAYGRFAPKLATSVGSGSSPVKVQAAIGVLTGSKLYHYRLVTKSPAGISYGSDQTLTTQAAEWSEQATPTVPARSYLKKVSCSSQSDCMAVGYNFKVPPGSMLSEHWDGKEWSVKPVPEPIEDATAATFTHVSCTAPTWCVATGWYQEGEQVKSVIERWDGKEWSIMWAPSTSAEILQLDKVSCISAEACVAVGFERSAPLNQLHSITAVWDGHEWAIKVDLEPLGTDGSKLEAVSCAGPSSCVAVGLYWVGTSTRPLALQWDGAVWNTIQDEVPAGASPEDITYQALQTVSCWSPDGCVASFRGGTTVERWDGETWTPESIPEPVGAAEGEFDVNLDSSCADAKSCLTVGLYRDYFRSYFLGGETWAPRATWFDGTDWSLGAVVNPGQEEEPNGRQAELLGTDCPAVGACLAVGSQYSLAKSESPLVERYHAPGAGAETLPAEDVVSDAADLSAWINPGGVATTYQFEYGPTTEYGSVLPASPSSAGSGTANVKVSEQLEGLSADTTYHFRVKATNAQGTTYGEDRTFSTSVLPRYSGAYGEFGAGKGQLNEPLGLAVDAKGNVWVADSENDRVQKFSPGGESLLSFGSSGTAAGQFDQPYALAIDSEENVWVADTWNNRIQKFNAKGEFLKAIGWGVDDGKNEFQSCTSSCFAGLSGKGSGQLYRPYGLTFDSGGNLWVADTWNNRTQKFNAKGEYLSQFEKRGVDIVVDDAGDVWLAQDNQDRVVKFNSKGEELAHLGTTKGSGTGQFDKPTGIGLDSGGNIWVADSENDRVQGFDPAGAFFFEFGESGAGNGQFDFPRDIAFSSTGDAWVADSNNSRIEKLRYSPSAVTKEATSVKPNRATLNGTINPEGSTATYYFEYGPTTSYGARTPIWPKSAGSGTSDVSVAQQVTGLEGKTTYHYRVVAESTATRVNGEDRVVTTTEGPEAVTQSATAIKATQATLNGSVNPHGNATNYYFEYGPTTSYGTKIPVSPAAVGSGTSNVAVSQTPTGLSQNTTYHYRVAAESGKGTTKGDDQTLTTLKLPKATTEAATSVKATEATLNGSVNPEGLATTYWFEYGPTTSYGTKIPVSPKAIGSGTSSVAVNQTPVGLFAGTTYHYRVVAESVGGTTNGADKTLTTLKAPKTITKSATGIKATQATLNGSVNPEGSATTYWFEYGTTTSYGTKIPVSPAAIGSGTAYVTVNQTPSGLSQNTTYHYRVVAENEKGTTNGADLTLTTLKVPKATTEAASSIKATEATLNAIVNPEGSATSYYFEYGPTTSYGTKIPVSPASVGSGTSNVAVSQTPTGLAQNTTYHYRVVAESAGGTANGADKTLTTLKAPKATTKSASNIKTTEATLNGSIIPEGSATSYWFEYGPTTSYGTKIPVSPVEVGSGGGLVVVNQTPTGLSAGTTYHYRVVAESVAARTNGVDQTLTTLKVPKATTEAASSIKATEATLNAGVNPEGSATSYYFEYGPTTSYGTKIPVSPAAIGSGTSNVAVNQTPTGLAQNTTYHYRVVAESAGGTANGADKTLTTLKAPKATTKSASNIKTTEATLNGSIIPEGSATSYWFEYGPTTSYGTKIPVSPKEVGSGGALVVVNQTPTGLTKNTTYHYRVVAESVAARTNGVDLTLTTLP